MRYVNKFLSMFVLTLAVFSAALVFSADVMAQVCDVQITKESVPEDGTEFPFTVTGDITDDFTLVSEETEQFDLPIGDTVMVAEQTPDGWGLRDINCRTNGGTTVSTEGMAADILCDEGGGQAFCTFTNSAKEAIPTLSQWSIIALIVVLGIVGFMVLRRKKVNA